MLSLDKGITAGFAAAASTVLADMNRRCGALTVFVICTLFGIAMNSVNAFAIIVFHNLHLAFSVCSKNFLIQKGCIL